MITKVAITNPNDGFCKDAIGIEAEVIKDIATRQEMGINKYGKTVSENPLNLKQWLNHAYEECLDQAIYLKRAIREIENKKG